MQGKMIGDYVVANFDKIDLNKDGKISYAMMKGEEGNVEAEYRTQYGVEDLRLKIRYIHHSHEREKVICV